MDPNESLKQLRAWSTAVLRRADTPGLRAEAWEVEAAEAFQALDQWLCAGGFKPRDWRLTVDYVDGSARVVERS